MRGYFQPSTGREAVSRQSRSFGRTHLFTTDTLGAAGVVNSDAEHRVDLVIIVVFVLVRDFHFTPVQSGDFEDRSAQTSPTQRDIEFGG